MKVFENKDCMEGMKEFPDKYFELAIIDPPYGHGKQVISNNESRGKLAIAKNYGEGIWNEKPPDIKYFNELFRISKNQIIWGGNYFTDKLFSSQCWIVWDKVNNGNDFADCELAWTSFDSAVRQFTYCWNGMLQGNMKNKEVRIHPTQKPIALYKWLLKNYAKEGNKILDTHAGSASSLIAFEDEGYEYVGYEHDKDYYETAQKRLEQFRSQLKIELK